MLELIPFGLLVFYLVPFVVAVARGHDGAMMVLAANLLVGWTVVGWFAVLAVALATPAEGLAAASKRSR
ncbi:MAG: superinfection immunity protein [Myxococcota bacterium]|nr:superinfection immunity protein [Myxococcota bacterium]